MEEKNWLKELVESSDFEYFDDENLEDLEDLEDDEYAIGKGKIKRVSQRANIKKPLNMRAKPMTTGKGGVPLQASPNPFNNPESYNNVSNLNFDLIVEASTACAFTSLSKPF